MEDKYMILVDGIAIAIASISEVSGEESFDDYNPIVRSLSKTLATAAKLESEVNNRCSLLIDAIAWTIAELLDCIDSGCTSQQSEIISNLARALAEAAKSTSKPQPLLMAGA